MIKQEQYLEQCEHNHWVGDYCEKCDDYKPTSKWWARTAYTLLVVSAFLLGRAYGWYEVHVYMKHLAEGLGVIAGSLK